MARARYLARIRNRTPPYRTPKEEDNLVEDDVEVIKSDKKLIEEHIASNQEDVRVNGGLPALSNDKKKKQKKNKKKEKEEDGDVDVESDDVDRDKLKNSKTKLKNGHAQFHTNSSDESPEHDDNDDLEVENDLESSSQEKAKRKRRRKKRKRNSQDHENDDQSALEGDEDDSRPVKRKRQDSESVIELKKDLEDGETEHSTEVSETEEQPEVNTATTQTERSSNRPGRIDFFHAFALNSSDIESYDSEDDGLNLLTAPFTSYYSNGGFNDGYEQGFSREELNSDQEIDNVISTIRPKPGLTFDGDRTEDASVNDYDGGQLMFPLEDESNSDPLDDEMDSSEEESDEPVEHESHSENELVFSDGANENENENDELEVPESVSDSSDSLSTSSSDVGTEYQHVSEAGEQYLTRDVLNCNIEGYQTVKNSKMLLSLCRKTAPKSRMGSFKCFKFTEKKLIEGHSVEIGEDAFCWMIAPLELNYFYKMIYERFVFHVSRHDSSFLKGIMTADSLLKVSQSYNLKYGQNLNVVKYCNASEKVLYFNPQTDKVYSKELKTLFETGYSFELLNPQIFFDEIWYLSDVLQELTNTVVRSKVYLTGKESSAFAPHCDDFNNMILQLEGKQIWRIWAPEYSYPNMDQEKFKESATPSRDTLKELKLVFEETLEEGDTLYIPKGFYYEAYTGIEHSLHLNIEWSKNMAFADMMRTVSKTVWDRIEDNEPLSKRSLPLNVLLMGGVAPIDYDHPPPDTDYLTHLRTVLGHVEKFYNQTIPVALDNLAKSFLQKALPPMLTDSEKKYSINGHPTLMIGDPTLKWTDDTEIKFIRIHTQRLLYDEEKNPYLGHRINNSRDIEQNTELKRLKLEKDMVRSVIVLFDQYPKWTRICRLRSTEEICMKLARLLYNNGLIMAN